MKPIIKNEPEWIREIVKDVEKQISIFKQQFKKFENINTIRKAKILLDKQLGNIKATDFNSEHIHALALKIPTYAIFPEDLIVAVELTALARLVDAAELGKLPFASNKLKFIGKENFLDNITVLLANRNTAELEGQNRAKAKMFFSGLILKVSAKDFNSKALRMLIETKKIKDNMPESSLIIKELNALAILAEKAEKGKLQPDQDLSILKIINKGPVLNKTKELLDTKMKQALKDQKETKKPKKKVSLFFNEATGDVNLVIKQKRDKHHRVALPKMAL